MTPSHRELCRAAARWLLEQRWCRVAGYEVGGCGDQFDAIGVSRIPDPDMNRLIDEEAAYVATEWQRRVDEWAAAKAEGRSARRPAYPKRRSGERHGKPGSHRIVVVEVKRSRSDLLADLRARKMLGYERVGTSCYLAATWEALGRERETTLHETVFAELAGLGLPPTWGVLEHTKDGWGRDAWFPLRPAALTRQAEPAVMRLWHDRIARSLAYRVTSLTSPMAGEGA